MPGTSQNRLKTASQEDGETKSNVESMEIDHKAVHVASPGDQIGLTVIEHAGEHDTVYLLS